MTTNTVEQHRAENLQTKKPNESPEDMALHVLKLFNFYKRKSDKEIERSIFEVFTQLEGYVSEVPGIETKMRECISDILNNKTEENKEEFEKNKIIWNEIQQGNYENYQEMTMLIPEIVQLIVSYCSEGGRTILSLPYLTGIDTHTAKILSTYKEHLSLNGLTSINEDVAKCFMDHKGELSLNGLTSFSKDVAKVLRKR